MQNNAEQAVRDMLISLARSRPSNQPIETLYAEDFMDDGSKIALTIQVNRYAV